MCLYAGSLVPEEILAHCPPGARIVNTAPLDLDMIVAEMAAAHAALERRGTTAFGRPLGVVGDGRATAPLACGRHPYTVTPGVPSFAAAAAALGAELTLPGLAQSVVLTHVGARSPCRPAKPGPVCCDLATLAVHLSIHRLAEVVAELTPTYGAACPVAVVYRASWPDEQIVRGTLATIEAAMGNGVERTALILVGPALAAEGFAESRLYASDYERRFRPTTASDGSPRA